MSKAERASELDLGEPVISEVAVDGHEEVTGAARRSWRGSSSEIGSGLMIR